MNGKHCDENKLQGRSAGRATLERLVKEGPWRKCSPGGEQRKSKGPGADGWCWL